jgi:hypothetical protein
MHEPGDPLISAVSEIDDGGSKEDLEVPRHRSSVLERLLTQRTDPVLGDFGVLETALARLAPGQPISLRVGP